MEHTVCTAIIFQGLEPEVDMLKYKFEEKYTSIFAFEIFWWIKSERSALVTYLNKEIWHRRLDANGVITRFSISLHAVFHWAVKHSSQLYYM